VKDRLKYYVKDNGKGILDIANKVYGSEVLYETAVTYPMIYQKIKNLGPISSMLTNIFLNKILFIFFLSFILYYSMMQSVIIIFLNQTI
jgi:hypothetical protein